MCVCVCMYFCLSVCLSVCLCLSVSLSLSVLTFDHHLFLQNWGGGPKGLKPYLLLHACNHSMGQQEVGKEGGILVLNSCLVTVIKHPEKKQLRGDCLFQHSSRFQSVTVGKSQWPGSWHLLLWSTHRSECVRAHLCMSHLFLCDIAPGPAMQQCCPLQLMLSR